MKVRSSVILAACSFAFAASSHAQFVSYNDCVSGDGPIGSANAANTTTFGTGTAGGVLKDFATSTALPVTVSVVDTTIGGNGGTGPTQFFSSGNDAYNLFYNKVATDTRVIYYGNGGLPSSWSVALNFAGLDPAKTYKLATTIDRGSASYTNQRWTNISISDADAFTNSSSAGAFQITGGSATVLDSYNSVLGYLAQWDNIAPGADGDFSITFRNAGTVAGTDIPLGMTQDTGKGGYGPAAFMLQEVTVPEPASMAVLGLGALALIRRRRA